MSDSGPFFSRLLSDVFSVGKAARDVVARRIPGDDPHTITLFRGFGADGRVLVHGRALEDEGIGRADVAHSRWRNLMAMLRRIESDPLPHAVVRVRVGSTSVELTADDEGFFHRWVDASDAERVDDEWVRIHADLITPLVRGLPVSVTGGALDPRQRPEILVISDVDDTVLQSNVTSFLVAVRTMLLENARTRLPFPGIAAFYQALRSGATGDRRNPIFYVSSSPWNLYDVISEFLEAQGIPIGPLLLRDVDLGLDALSSSRHHVHKREMVRSILTTYPGVPAILIGDSGQHDPEIYRDVVSEFPGRIHAVYIRNVTRHPERSAAIQALAEEVLAAGSSLVLADDTLAAARHAAEQGWIAREALAGIGEEKRADEGVTEEKKSVPGTRDEGDEPGKTVVVE